MISRNTYLASLVPLAVLGCAGDDTTDDGDRDPDVCELAGEPCTGDTICGESECEPAFDRDYQVHVAMTWQLGKGFGTCPNSPDCAMEDVTVYFDDGIAPILGRGISPAVAEVLVKQGSTMAVELKNSDCLIHLSAEKLRSGVVSCSGPTMTAFLGLEAMPL